MTLSVRTRTLLVCLCVFLFAAFRTPARAEVSTPRQAAYQIQSVEWDEASDDVLRIAGNSAPAYTIYELFDPLRIVIDIADAALRKTATLPLQVARGPVTRVTGLFLGTQKPVVTRIEVILAQDHPYAVERAGNDILVKFARETSSAGLEEESASPSAPTKEEVDKIVTSLKEEQPVDQASLNGSAIGKIIVNKGPMATRVNIISGAAITKFEHFQLKKAAGKPDRMYIDIPNIGFSGTEAHQIVGTALARVRAARRANGVRIVFDSGLDKLFGYNITPTTQGLAVLINETGTEPPTKEQLTAAAAETVQVEPLTSTSVQTGPSTSKQPPPPSSSTGKVADDNEKQMPDRVASALEAFDFGGYNKQKISIDFFKIDIHNVFRMFREISGQNIVVDEGVTGSLTLSLNDVPWDFALDVILHLKDLQKEERFNTIVILPKAKALSWPKRTTDAIAVKSDGTTAKVEAFTITKKQEIPEAVIEAKKLIMQAQAKEKAEDYQGALPLYEEAFNKWKDNSELASRITVLCLVHLGQNAKAAHYAKTALKLNPKNFDAALQAAVAYANMKKTAEAKGYFDIALSAPQPASEALKSYSAFAEENGDYDVSLSLLDKHVEIYGATLDTMVYKARVYDKKGNEAKAINEYRDILLAGFEIPPDLLRYIKGRIAASVH